MSVSIDEIKRRGQANNELFVMAMEVVKQKYDVYAFVASKIFNKDYDCCHERYEEGDANPTGKMMRDIAKKICTNTESIQSLSERYKIPYLGQLVIKAFPFTYPYDIEEETDPDFPTGDATTFIVNMTGYVRFIHFMEKQDEIDDQFNFKYMVED